MSNLKKVARIIWDYLTEVCGENDYARYRARLLARLEPPVSRKEFYLSQLRRKYSRPNRCC